MEAVLEIALLIGFVLLLYGLTDFLFRLMGLGALAWGSRAESKIALTFDDGPSQRTGEILELLHQHGEKATFFLTGRQAEKHPELVEKLRQAGHQIETHGYWHRPAVLMAPWTEWTHIARSPGRLYRPPWGIHSLFTRPIAFLLGKRIALWDTESRDWLEESPAEIAARLVFYTKPGSVLLFHDGPERTLRVLEHLLPRLKELGYQPVRMDEMSMQPLNVRGGILRALQGFDERYDREHGNFRAGFRPFDIFRLEKKPFPGPSVEGIPVGAPCYEVHLESARLSGLSPMQVLRAFRESLKEVAKHVQADPEIRLIYGYSYLAHGAKVIGFKAAPLPARDEFIATFASLWFLWLYRGEAPKRERSKAELSYMTREDLLERYGKVSEDTQA
ncbi:MAG: polysaccharide deacetylase family protein [Meiothermus sp.]